MFCACGIIQLLSVVLYVVRIVHKFYFRPVVNETTNKCRPVFVLKNTSGSREIHVFDKVCMFSPDHHRQC